MHPRLRSRRRPSSYQRNKMTTLSLRTSRLILVTALAAVCGCSGSSEVTTPTTTSAAPVVCQDALKTDLGGSSGADVEPTPALVKLSTCKGDEHGDVEIGPNGCGP